MRRTTYRSLVYYQFSNFLERDNLVHGVFTRLGGHSQPPWASLNTGHTVGDDLEAVEANHDLIFGALGVCRESVVSPHQVHSTMVRVVGEGNRGQVCPETDALVTDSPHVALMLRFADCVPILLYDPVRVVVGLAHAGWRGTVNGIASAVVQTMVDEMGCDPKNILAGIGPSIGPCCYEVGDEVAEAASSAFSDARAVLAPKSDGRWYFNLWVANWRQLADAGVQNVETAGICTACHTDEWFSHRAERGKTGRLGAMISLDKG